MVGYARCVASPEGVALARFPPRFAVTPLRGGRHAHPTDRRARPFHASAHRFHAGLTARRTPRSSAHLTPGPDHAVTTIPPDPGGTPPVLAHPERLSRGLTEYVSCGVRWSVTDHALWGVLLTSAPPRSDRAPRPARPAPGTASLPGGAALSRERRRPAPEGTSLVGHEGQRCRLAASTHGSTAGPFCEVGGGWRSFLHDVAILLRRVKPATAVTTASVPGHGRRGPATALPTPSRSGVP